MGREFFLGGADLEMVAVRQLLMDAGARFCDKGLAWGARASAYREEIAAALAAGRQPVLVELEDDLGLPLNRVLIVDHHGPQSGDQNSALRQVFDLLGIPPSCWTRWQALVAANDRGHIPAMAAMGASAEEIAQVRTADRRAQGITPTQEAAGVRAAQEAEVLLGGRLHVVHLPHAQTATVADRLHPASGVENLLIVSPDEVNFYGSGRLVALLDCRIPGGWTGGELPARGYWGHAGRPDVLPILMGALHE